MQHNAGFGGPPADFAPSSPSSLWPCQLTQNVTDTEAPEAGSNPITLLTKIHVMEVGDSTETEEVVWKLDKLSMAMCI